ncbi:MAG: KamA family radical SAM protein, partial [Oscillospiraceae bacterium]
MEDRTAALTTAEELDKIIPLPENEKKAISQVRACYGMRITPYYASLIDPRDENSPIRRQCVPSLEELNNPAHFENDPLHENACSPVPYLTHKYPDRAAFYICNSCFTLCRHCTRKNTVIKGRRVTHAQFEEVLAYLRGTPQIRDVLVTGGDPLTLEDEELDYFLSRLRAIPHVQTLR